MSIRILKYNGLNIAGRDLSYVLHELLGNVISISMTEKKLNITDFVLNLRNEKMKPSRLKTVDMQNVLLAMTIEFSVEYRDKEVDETDFICFLSKAICDLIT